MTASVTDLPTAAPAPVRPPARRLVLTGSGLLDVAEAERFLVELADRMDGADVPRLAFLLGQAEGHLTNLVDLVRAATELTR
jgi:hypothetical protein